MKKNISLGLALAAFALCFAFTSTNVFAGEETVSGKVKVTKAEGKVTAITIVAEKAEYAVKLDDKGSKLAEADGKVVEAKGTVEEKEGKKTLTVTEFKVKEEPKK